MRNYRELKVWEKAHELTLAVYTSTAVFPPQERFGLVSQMRRAAVSIGGNIAEGCGKNSDADFCRFLQIALGSATELEYYLFLSVDLGFLKSGAEQELLRQASELKRMLTRFIQAITPKARRAKA